MSLTQRPSPEDLIVEVARKHGVTVDELGGRSRRPREYLARHEAFWVLSRQMKTPTVARWSTPQIGYLVAADDRMPFDHTTVLSGISRHQARLDAATLGVRPPRTSCRGKKRVVEPRRRGTPGAYQGVLLEQDL